MIGTLGQKVVRSGPPCHVRVPGTVGNDGRPEICPTTSEKGRIDQSRARYVELADECIAGNRAQKASLLKRIDGRNGTGTRLAGHVRVTLNIHRYAEIQIGPIAAEVSGVRKCGARRIQLGNESVKRIPAEGCIQWILGGKSVGAGVPVR